MERRYAWNGATHGEELHNYGEESRMEKVTHKEELRMDRSYA